MIVYKDSIFWISLNLNDEKILIIASHNNLYVVFEAIKNVEYYYNIVINYRTNFYCGL